MKLVKRKFFAVGSSMIVGLALMLSYQNCGSPMSFDEMSSNVGQSQVDPAVSFRLSAPATALVNTSFNVRIDADESVDSVRWMLTEMNAGRPVFTELGAGETASLNFETEGVRMMTVEVSRGNWTEKVAFNVFIQNEATQACPVNIDSSAFAVIGLRRIPISDLTGNEAVGLYSINPTFYSSPVTNELCFSVTQVLYTIELVGGRIRQQFTGRPAAEIRFPSAGNYILSADLTVRNHISNSDVSLNIRRDTIEVVEGTPEEICPTPNFTLAGPGSVRVGAQAKYDLTSDCLPRRIEQVAWTLKDNKNSLLLQEDVSSTLLTNFTRLLPGSYTLHADIKLEGKADLYRATPLPVVLTEEPINCPAVERSVQLSEGTFEVGRRTVFASLMPSSCLDSRFFDTVWVVNNRVVQDTPGLFTDRLDITGSGLTQVNLFVYETRQGQVPPCLFEKIPCKIGGAPSPVFRNQITVDLGKLSAPTPGYKWLSSHCTGQCVSTPWWTVSPKGYICLNTSVRNSPPDNPYQPEKCGQEPAEPARFDGDCPTVCSPWNNSAM